MNFSGRRSRSQAWQIVTVATSPSGDGNIIIPPCAAIPPVKGTGKGGRLDPEQERWGCSQVIHQLGLVAIGPTVQPAASVTFAYPYPVSHDTPPSRIFKRLIVSFPGIPTILLRHWCSVSGIGTITPLEVFEIDQRAVSRSLESPTKFTSTWKTKCIKLLWHCVCQIIIPFGLFN